MSDRFEIDVFWSFRSPWSYLATKRLRGWQESYQLRVNFRPVYPIAVRTPEFFQEVRPQWFSYFRTDVYRVADFLELPFVWATRGHMKLVCAYLVNRAEREQSHLYTQPYYEG